MPIQKLRPTFTFDQDRIAQLRAIAPEAFAGGKINWDVLKEALGENLEDESPNAEHFGLFWPGKREARRFASKPSSGTLIPARGEGVDEETTHNIFIEGDNLEVLKLLQKSYAGQVKMIYIDPPYNTGNDFVYEDNFTEPLEDYLRKTGQTSETGELLTTNSRASGRFHTNWLNMMYPRLRLARNLLCEDGVLFVSIDDNESHNLHQMLNEVFGEENFVAVFPWRKRTAKSDVPFHVSQDYEWIICFAKSKSFSAAIEGNPRKYYESPDLPGRQWRIHEMTTHRTAKERPNSNFTIVNPKTGAKYPVNPNAVWRVTRESFEKFYKENKIVFPGDYDFINISKPVLRYFKDEDEAKAGEEFGFVSVTTNLPKEIGMTQDGTKDIAKLFDDKVFGFPKPVNLINHFIKISTALDKSAIILDIFAGSCTTAQAVAELNNEDEGERRFIMVQLPEPIEDSEFSTIAEIGKERIRRVSKNLQEEDATGDLGFRVFKLAPSNFKQWRDYDGQDLDALETQFAQFETPLVDGWTRENLLTEILLQQGFPLDSTLTPQKEFTKNGVVAVSSPASAHKLFICLDEKIHDATIQQLKLAKRDVFICLDSALSSEAKVRLGDTMNLVVI